MVIRELMLTMSDGVRLYTRIVLPEDGAGKYPTVFMRTPYDKNTDVTEELRSKYENDRFIKRGYAIVLQHCRGRYGSEGACVPYSDEERSDGLETLDFIRRMPHYNGQLFLCGKSYTASVLLMLLNEDIPDLVGMAIDAQTESMYHRNYINGMCRSFCGFSWWLSMISGQRPKIAGDGDIFVRPYIDIMKRATGADLPEFTEELLHDRFDDFWKNDPRIGVIEKLRVPVLFTSGWYDYYCYGMCRMWEKLAPDVRKRSCFMMSPWGHGLCEREDTEYPMPGGVLPAERAGEWFDHLRGIAPFTCGEIGKFNYYSIGEDRWHSAVSPYENQPSEAFFFSADGALTKTSPVRGERSYAYDPENPRHHDRHDNIYRCYPENSCEDVLSFLSEPFSEDAAFFGPVSYRLKLMSDCEDTAFFMRLYIVKDGCSYNLVDAATTLLYAAPNARPNEAAEVNVISQPTAFYVKKGDRVRVDISSFSDCFIPHQNTREPLALATRVLTARNTLICGDSLVLLPRIDK